MVVTIEEFKNLSQMHIDELTGSLLAHESRMNRYDETLLETVFKSQLNVTRGKGIGRGGRSAGHSDNRNDSENEEKLQQSTPSVRGNSSRAGQPENQRYGRSKVQCFYYKKFGHFANTCWKKQANNNKLSTHQIEETENEEKPMFLTCNVTQESSKDIWFLDNACNNRMTGNKELFSSLDTSIRS